MKQDIKDISEKELTKLYAEYQAGLGRPVPAVVHRQGRSIPGCVSAEDFAAWKLVRSEVVKSIETENRMSALGHKRT